MGWSGRKRARDGENLHFFPRIVSYSAPGLRIVIGERICIETGVTGLVGVRS